jgi:excinuclease ABC subunit A
VVVEHEASVMRAADRIIDLGPGHGATGGEVVFEGPYAELMMSESSLTGAYLSGRTQIEIPARRPVASDLSSREIFFNDAPAGAIPSRDISKHPGTLRLSHVTRHNLVDLGVDIPLGRFVCVTGVSGSGKSTLVRDALLPALQGRLNSRNANFRATTARASDRIEPLSSEPASAGVEEEAGAAKPDPAASTVLTGWEPLGRAVLVDQSILGKTPRSNPAVYTGAFDDIRELFAQSESARQRGLNASAFSFNSSQGQCERCRGAGFEKIEMQFLSDVFIRCPDCQGRRYRQHILQVKMVGQRPRAGSHGTGPRRRTRNPRPATVSWSIADLLEATVDECLDFLGAFAEVRAGVRAVEKLKLLQEVGLGYLRLGQPINTLSGGESQRLKLVRHLAESGLEDQGVIQPGASTLERPLPTLFVFDEPTTGLHFDDVRVLLKVFQRLVDAGHSVIVVEHNLDVIKTADWVIDLGPEAGRGGGKIVVQGTPEQVAQCDSSHTGQFLQGMLGNPWNSRGGKPSPGPKRGGLRERDCSPVAENSRD